MKRPERLARTALCYASCFFAAANAADQDVVQQSDHVLVVEFVPPDDGYDWLKLVSGEWLRGELIGAFSDEVEFDSVILDELVIDAEDIDQFYSPRTLSVSIRGHDIITGTVHVQSDTLIVQVDDETLEFSRKELIAVAARAERERDRWSGDISAGISLREGNSDFLEYNMIVGVERSTARSRTIIDYIGNYNKTEGIQVANNHRVSGVLDRFGGARLFWRPLFVQYFRDPFQNIEHQGTLETGLGYELVDTSRIEWDIFSGLGSNHVQRVSVEQGQQASSISPAFSLGTNFEAEVTTWMDYLISFTATFVDEESGSYQHHLLTTLSSDLIGNFDLDVSFVWDRTQNPPTLADGSTPEKNDIRLLVSLSYDF